MDLDQIRQAQIIAGENAVIARLQAQGLIPKEENSDKSLLFYNLFREVRNEITTDGKYVLEDAIRKTFDRWEVNNK